MDDFKYEGAVQILLDGDTYLLLNAGKLTKTRTVKSSKGFSRTIQTADIRVSPRTYRTIGSYDRYFQDYNTTHCHLCNEHPLQGYTCACPPSFTVAEHFRNIPTVRRNYVKYELRIARMEEHLPLVDSLSDRDIKALIFRDENDCRILLDVVTSFKEKILC